MDKGLGGLVFSERVNVELGQSYTAYDETYKFEYTPSESGYYKLDSSFYKMYYGSKQCKERYGEGSGTYYLSAGKKYTVKCSDGDYYYSFSLNKCTVSKAKINKKYSFGKNNEKMYEFKASKTGYYSFDTTQFSGLKVFSNNKALREVFGNNRIYKLTEGKTYVVKADRWAESNSTFKINRMNIKDMSLNKKYLSKRGNICIYQFSPKQTGYYSLNLPEGSYASIYNNSKFIYSYFDNIYKFTKGRKYTFQFYEDTRFSIAKVTVKTKNKVTYHLQDNDTWRVISVDGNQKNVNIAEKLLDKKVSMIEGYLVKEPEKSKIEKITIPSGVTEIEYGAFLNLPKLKNLTFAKDSHLLRIGNSAFAYTSLSKVELPSSVKDISHSSFSDTRWSKNKKGMAYLNDIALGYYNEINPNTIATIKYGTKIIATEAFFCNENVTNVEIPYGVTSIGDRVFAYSGIKSVYIPKSITKIGDNIFGYSFDGEQADYEITGIKGSYAEKYAKANKIKFKAVSCKAHKWVKEGNKRVCRVCGKKK